jgi:hypothetical protein
MELCSYQSTLSCANRGFGALLYVDRKYVSLEQRVDSLSTTAAAVIAFTLPAFSSDTMAERSVKVDFPRQHPLLILAAQRGCPYCRLALQSWASLRRNRPQLDGFVYDPGGSYPLRNLQQAGVDPATVLTTRIDVSPYDRLFGATPTVMLIERSGRVLAVWIGELSHDRLAQIQAAINRLSQQNTAKRSIL